ncbi:hypothetical protein [Pedobacter psychrodurus]|uniref:hypothetical protein n=1 Tax=Pedobacter psychrodurus TaxID=2530456 RepID=UPI0019824CF1|nr:hypothetical protein [Pedobacter psychrodurus]
MEIYRKADEVIQSSFRNGAIEMHQIPIAYLNYNNSSFPISYIQEHIEAAKTI